MPTLKPVKIVCSEKRALTEYALLADVHSQDVREYAAYVLDARDGAGLERAKARVAESKERFQNARQRSNMVFRPSTKRASRCHGGWW